MGSNWSCPACGHTDYRIDGTDRRCKACGAVSDSAQTVPDPAALRRTSQIYTTGGWTVAIAGLGWALITALELPAGARWAAAMPGALGLAVGFSLVAVGTALRVESHTLSLLKALEPTHSHPRN